MTSTSQVDSLFGRDWDRFAEAETKLYNAIRLDGFAINIHRKENKDSGVETGYRRHVYTCWKAYHHRALVAECDRKRKHTATRTGCTWRIVLTFYKTNKKWRFIWQSVGKGDESTLTNQHNHELLESDEAGLIASNRKRARKEHPTIEEDIISLGKQPELSIDDILKMIREKYPNCKFVRHDIQNMLQKAKPEMFGDLARQQFFNAS